MTRASLHPWFVILPALASMAAAPATRPAGPSTEHTEQLRTTLRHLENVTVYFPDMEALKDMVTGEDLPMLLLLSLADCYSYRRLKLKKIVPLKKQLQVIRELFSRYYSDKAKMDGPRLVDGHVLMKALRLKPGPVIGKLLSAVTEAQLLGKVKTRAEALTLARKSLTRLKK